MNAVVELFARLGIPWGSQEGPERMPEEWRRAWREAHGG